MNVTHDLIAAVTGPGWKFGLSRILINDENEGVVFIAGSQEPFASFTVDNVRAARGTGTTDEGEITWRRRGSSCQYKLAKCKINTETMTQWWEDSLPQVTGRHVAEEPPPEPDDTQEMDMDAVPDGTYADVMAWVGDDVDRAQAALTAEQDGKQRVGLTADLEKMLAAKELL